MTYFWMEYKKSFYLFKKLLIGLICMLLGVLICLFGIVKVLEKTNQLTQIEVAVVIPDSETTTKKAANLAFSMDSVRSICGFTEYEGTEEALQDLQEKKVEAVIVFPENFYEDANNGINTPATIYTLDSLGDSQKLFLELVEDGVGLLQISEAGVYSSLYVYRSGLYETRVSEAEIGNVLMERYIKKVLLSQGIMKREYVSALGTLDYAEYVVVAVLFLLFLYVGFMMGSFYNASEKAIEETLKIRGMMGWQIDFLKVAAISNVLFCVFLVYEFILFGASFFMEEIAFQFSVQKGFCVLVFSLFFSVLLHGGYSLFSSEKNATMAIVIMSFCMVLGTGALLPMAFLPEKMQKLFQLLHMNAWGGFLQAAYRGHFDTGAFWILVLYGAILFLIRQLTRKIHWNWKK